MTMMKLSNYIAQKLVEHGVSDVFMVTGGGAMHMNHSFGTHPKIKATFNHHEQACAMAAEAYYRLTNRLPVVNVTSGPGGTNAITGVYGAFVDSIGMLVISGQVKYETTVRSTGLPLRQYGDQELDIEELVRPVTKYVHMVTEPETIRYHLEKAIYLAKAGRPGPCWLDIPLNVQGAQIDPDTLKGFDPSELDEPWKKTDLKAATARILDKLRSAKRPVVFAGGGVRLSG
ncbi:MAG: thiamine pyrophosphate protein binding domain protein, partial [Ramlibacter sp.]|nr:thiamine pyrophosphate protein binding domain protein [Ramlibacter sp.]